MAEPRRILVGSRELQLPKCITVAGNSVRLFYHFNSFRLHSEAQENVPGDFSVSSKTGVTGSTGIFGLRGLTKTNVLRMSMVRDTLFPLERGTDEAMHPLVGSRVLRIYERKNPIQSALLSALLDQGHDKVFRIEQFESKFCEQAQRRVDTVVAACTLKVSELRAIHQDRVRHLMALTLARPTIAGGGFNWNDSAIGSGSGKEAAGGGGTTAPSREGGSPRAGPKSARTLGRESPGAGSSSERVSRGKEASRASKRKRSPSPFPSPANGSPGLSGGTPKRSATPDGNGREPPGSGRCPNEADNYDDYSYGRQEDGGPLGSPPENGEAEGRERAGLTVKLSPEAEVRRSKWLDAVDENDKRFQEVRERVSQEMARAEELHRSRSLELFRWSVDEQRGKHTGSGCDGPPSMSRELELEPRGGGRSSSSSSLSATAPSSAKTPSQAEAAALTPGALSDARVRAKKYIEAVAENDARLLNRKDCLRAEQERAQEEHHARSLELFAWDVEERTGKHDALGSEGPQC